MTSVTSSMNDAICTLALNRPEKLNALNREMYTLLTEGFRSANADNNCRVIIIKGTKGVFTAGNDLADFATALTQVDGSFDSPFLLMNAILDSTKPIIASVDGPAIGVGATMLFHFDLVYASHSASIHTPFADLGVCPEFASSETFPALLGHHRAAQLLLLGEPLTATDAAQAGLFNKLVDTNDLDQTVNSTATALSKKPSDALQTSRNLLNQRKQHYKEIIKREGEQFARLMQTDEFKNNLTAFLKKSSS